MICSARPGKSGSNWLDRLRSNKGIPTGDGLDLDSFLLSTHSHSHSPQARPTNPARDRPSETHDQPMTVVLAELFNTGATLTLTSKKCPRKQTNPKIFLASSATNSGNNAPAPAPAGDAAVPEEEEAALDRGGEEEEENDDDDDDDGQDLKGFTRSEVTVIDTSCPGWKVDKFVFRKNGVWKVRQRKPKTKFFAKKKSKALGIDDGIGTSKDNVVNMGGEKPVKKQKVI